MNDYVKARNKKWKELSVIRKRWTWKEGADWAREYSLAEAGGWNMDESDGAFKNAMNKIRHEVNPEGDLYFKWGAYWARTYTLKENLVSA